jgi:hypothetical protein
MIDEKQVTEIKTEIEWLVDSCYTNTVLSHLDDLSKIYEIKIAELKKDMAYYRCCALSGEVPDELCKPSNVAIQIKTLAGRL